MKTGGILLAGLLVLASQSRAQRLKWNDEKLAARASDVVEVTVDGPLLKLAGRFLSDDDEDEAQVKKLVAGLKGIYVKNFEFKNPGEYSPADLENFRAQLKGPEWERVVGVHSKEDGEDVEVYIKKDPKGMGGLAIIATEPKELTLVNIVGPIDLDTLTELGGHWNIPEIEKQKKK
jgi:Domain of unknown function (DUF4252)